MRRTTPISPQIAAAIAARRRAAGLTQNTLALEVGLSEATISKLETSRVPCPETTLIVIERAIDRLVADRARTAL